MSERKTQVRQVDGKGRVTLPAGFAGKTVLIEVVSAVEVRVRIANVIPLSEADAAQFLAALDDPPKPKRALKRLMRKKPE